jgi:hypothetical protein
MQMRRAAEIARTSSARSYVNVRFCESAQLERVGRLEKAVENFVQFALVCAARDKAAVSHSRGEDEHSCRNVRVSECRDVVEVAFDFGGEAGLKRCARPLAARPFAAAGNG